MDHVHAVDFESEMGEVGLVPEPRPRGLDRFEWERHRFFNLARAMVDQDLTPIQAAELFDAQVPKEAIEIHDRVASKGDHPGGLKPEEGLVWLVMARAETAGEPLAAPVSERITAEMLQRACAVYDPAFRQAKVIIGRDGPAHFTGRFKPPLGLIRAVEFDGHFVWGLVEHDQFELFWNVSRGAGARSIWVRPNSELEGKPPYIDHLALLWHEWPVQPNLPDLSQWLPGPEHEAPLTGFARAVSLATELEEDPMDPKNKKKTTTEEAPGWFRSAFTDALKLAGIKADPDPDPKPKPDVTDDGKSRAVPDVGAMIAEALKPIVEGQKKITDQLTAQGTARAEAEKTALHARIDSTIDGLVSSFRATPAEADGWRKSLKVDGLPAEHVDKTLAMLGSGPMREDLSRSAVVDLGDAGTHEAQVDPHLITSPDGLYRASPAAVQSLAAVKALARSRAGGDPEKEQQITSQILLHGDPELNAGVN